ncbi:MAG: ribokinase [Clostridia bacterium]|nr:ribokinase [Clostridia bacterium]
MRILNYGSMNIDYVYRVDRFVQPGETKPTKSLMVNCGGKGLNQSIAAARAGNTVLHAGLLGTDGQMLRDKLAENGVDTALLLPADTVSGHAIIEVDDAGQNRILLYGGANRALTKTQIQQTLDAFGSEGLVLLQNEVNLVGTIMREAKARGLLVAFNAAPMDEAIREYPLELIDYLIVNENEGRAIANCERDEDILPILAKRYPRCGILLTLGKRGALFTRSGRGAMIGACDVRAVDTTAAGDTFSGYFLYGMLNALSVQDSLRLATAASALCVTRPGASDSVPRRDEVDEALRNGTLAVPEAKTL